MKPTCSICETARYALGYCRRHYRAFKKWGDPMKKPPTLGERLLSRYEVDAEGCWLWTSQLNNKGYGLIWSNDFGQKVPAHRVSYELMKGPIAEGFELDHLCRKPACINPDHLEVVTHAENMRRLSEAQTACRRVGHDWSEPRNVYVAPDGRRKCRACARENDRLRGKRAA